MRDGLKAVPYGPRAERLCVLCDPPTWPTWPTW